MQREIKFRAWDTIYKKEGEMVSWNGWNSMQNWGIDRLNGRAHLTFMQYTGLKDKNSVDIYEGDLLGTHRTQNVIDVIGEVIFDIDFVAFTIKYTNGGWAYLWEHLSNKLNTGHEVMGNIYQNPELLESK